MSKHPCEAKVALITGAARRIGAEIARTLHDHGLNVVLHYNVSEADASHLCAELNQKRPNSAVIQRADLITQGSEKSLVDRAAKAWDRLDVLINNASRFYKTEVENASEFSWEDLMGSNVKAPFFLAQAACPYLKSTKGVIINIADIHGEKPLRNYSIYCISKAALLMMTKSLAKELGPDIRVNAVSPGAIIWPEGENALLENQKESIIAETALNRVGCAKDIAKTVLFFVCEADYVTGQVINVDGGRSIT